MKATCAKQITKKKRIVIGRECQRRVGKISPWAFPGTVGNSRQMGRLVDRRQGFSGMGVKGRRMKDRSSGIWQDHTITGLEDILTYEEMMLWWSQSEAKQPPSIQEHASEVMGTGVEGKIYPDWRGRQRTQFGNCSVLTTKVGLFLALKCHDVNWQCLRTVWRSCH